MSMKVRKVMSKETKAKMIFALVLVWAVVMLSIPYFTNVLNTVSEQTAETEIEIPSSAEPTEPEVMEEPEAEPVTEAAEAETATETNNEGYAVYQSEDVQPVDAGVDPGVNAETPVTAGQAEPQTYVDDRGGDDDGSTSVNIDDNLND